jgi:hypothetical protein
LSTFSFPDATTALREASPYRLAPKQKKSDLAVEMGFAMVQKWVPIVLKTAQRMIPP